MAQIVSKIGPKRKRARWILGEAKNFEAVRVASCVTIAWLPSGLLWIGVTLRSSAPVTIRIIQKFAFRTVFGDLRERAVEKNSKNAVYSQVSIVLVSPPQLNPMQV